MTLKLGDPNLPSTCTRYMHAQLNSVTPICANESIWFRPFAARAQLRDVFSSSRPPPPASHLSLPGCPRNSNTLWMAWFRMVASAPHDSASPHTSPDQLLGSYEALRRCFINTRKTENAVTGFKGYRPASRLLSVNAGEPLLSLLFLHLLRVKSMHVTQGTYIKLLVRVGMHAGGVRHTVGAACACT